MTDNKIGQFFKRFALLRNRNFSFLWAGQAVSRLGDALFMVAQAWLVLELTGSAMAMSATMLFNMLPSLLFMLVGGVSVDRYDRRRIAILADILRALSTIAFGWLAWSGQVQIWHVYLLSAIYGVTSDFFDIAHTALVPMVVSQEQVLSANSLISLTRELCAIIGPILGGILAIQIGIGGVAFIRAFLFAISVVTLLGISRSVLLQPATETARQSFWQEITTGWRYIKAHRGLLMLLIVVAVINFGALPLGVHLPVFVEKSLHADVQALGLLNSSDGVGKLLGSLAVGAIGDISRPGSFIMGVFFIQSILQIFFSLSSNMNVALPLYAAISVFQISGAVVLTTIFQTVVPDELRGRIISIFYLVSMALMPASLVIWGIIADAVNVVLVFVLGSVIMGLATVVGLLTPKVKELTFDSQAL